MKKITPIFLAILIAITSSLTTLAFEKTLGTPFPDVDYDAYYGDAVIDMAYAGIITGYDNGNFGPKDFVTRAQLVTILNRYDQKLVGVPAVSSGLGVGDLINIICDGFDETDFEDNENNTLQTFNDVCSARFQ